MRDPVVEDELFEPFDALLDEVVRDAAVGGGAVVAPSRGSRWLAVGGAASASRGSRLLAAALILLGVGVVAGVMWLKRPSDAVVPAQEPVKEPVQGGGQQQGQETVLLPKDLDEWRKLLPHLRKIVATRMRPAGGAPGLVKSEDEVALVCDPEQVTHWRDALLAALEPPVTYATAGKLDDGPSGHTRSVTVELMLHLDDGRVLPAGAWLDMPLFWFGEQGVKVESNSPLVGLLEDVVLETHRNGALACFEVWSAEDLRLLPSSSKSVACPFLTVEQARTELPRFTALERLVFTGMTFHWGKDANAAVRAGGGASVDVAFVPSPHGEVVAVIASLQTLRLLSMPIGQFDAQDLHMLAKLPNLEELILSARLPPALPTGFREFGPRLRTLRVQFADATDSFTPAHPAWNELHAAQRQAIAGFCADVCGMPALRYLQLSGCRSFGSALSENLEQLQVQHLDLDIPTVDGDLAAHLARMPNLRELSLFHLSPGQDILALAKALPNCRIETARAADAPK